jgi:hypothetical protein
MDAASDDLRMLSGGAYATPTAWAGCRTGAPGQLTAPAAVLRSSPQRNVNEISGVRNTNQAPATTCNGLHRRAPNCRVGALLSAVGAQMIAR